jgi:hypothetical protein
MVAVAVPLAWKMNRVSAQRRVVAMIENAGGFVEYDYAAESFRTNPTGEPTPPGPPWLRWMLGDDLFAEVAEVHLYDVNAYQADVMQVIGTLPGVTHIEARNVTDAWLAEFRPAPTVVSLDLRGTFTDASVARLKELTHLTKLKLSSPLLTMPEGPSC